MENEHIHRSIKLIMQNSTNEEFTVDGHDTLRGEWQEEPETGAFIEAQSTTEWCIVSRIDQEGASGFIRLNSVAGAIKISVQRPWTGPFQVETDVPQALSATVRVDEESPDHPVVLIEVVPSPKREH